MSDADDRWVLPYEEDPNPTMIDLDVGEWPVSDHVIVVGGVAYTVSGTPLGALRFGFGLDPMDHSVAATTCVMDETSLRLFRDMAVQAIDRVIALVVEAKSG